MWSVTVYIDAAIDDSMQSQFLISAAVPLAFMSWTLRLQSRRLRDLNLNKFLVLLANFVTAGRLIMINNLKI